jgi:hypothetical protein
MVSDVVISINPSSVSIEPKIAQVVIKTTGIAGPPGASGSGTLFSRFAATDLGGHRAVRIGADNLAYYADQALLANASVVGITDSAVSSGGAVTIRSEGEVSEPSWAWEPGAIYLGSNGQLTQTAPTTGVLVEVGVAAGPTKMCVSPRIIARIS